MRSISALSTVVAAAVLMLGLAACDKEDNSAKATSTTAHATTTHPTTTYSSKRKYHCIEPGCNKSFTTR